MRRLRILITDADAGMRKFIRSHLEARGFQTCEAADGNETLRIVERESLALIIMDTWLSDMDALEVCQQVREKSRVPLMLLGTRTDEPYTVRCLNAGADDYLPKPFGSEELIARIHAILRRNDTLAAAPALPFFSDGDLTIQFTQRKVTVAGQEIKLTPTEYSLLKELALHADKVLTHNLLLSKVWGPEYLQEKQYLRVFVRHLRKKLELDSGKQNKIVTIPWVGYKLTTQPYQ